MTPSEYIENTAVTDHDYEGLKGLMERCAYHASLLHYVLGVGTEAGELQDALKKYIAYNKPIDKVNIKEEVGDCLFYLARICSVFGWSFEEVMEVNINKLKKRYGDKFTEHSALNRDLEAERKILET